MGGLRNTVRQELVARQLDEQLAALRPAALHPAAQAPGAQAPGAGNAAASTGSAAAGLRILDVGPGQGTQALRLARAGHRVTGL
ncbi:MAG: hypothetical protein FWE15_29600, partial [Actinomycetia bacterium]|nr:hypothetical protein [Actinomycetes bacterium]